VCVCVCVCACALLGSVQVEINVTSIQTGKVIKSTVVNGVGHQGSAVIRPLLSLPLSSISHHTELITTRLLSTSTTAQAQAQATTSETVHPLVCPPHATPLLWQPLTQLTQRSVQESDQRFLYGLTD
jgi:hypothetical protein